MKTLLSVIKSTQANTMMGLQDELRQASQLMLQYTNHPDTNILRGQSQIALQSGCELFLQYVTRTFLELPSFEQCKSMILERAEQFSFLSEHAKQRIGSIGPEFIQDGDCVLIYGYSSVVLELLVQAANYWDKQFEIILLETRPDASGVRMANEIQSKAPGIPTTMVLDSAMGYVMERHVDLVIVGAEGVVENGGIVNRMGTYALGICAKELNKPFYVAVESYKFARLFPLNQADLPNMQKVNVIQGREVLGGGHDLTFVDTVNLKNESVDTPTSDHPSFYSKGTSIPGEVSLPSQVKVENPPCDYTPAKYITLLFTDLGVFTPAAVSDELIRLYQ